MSQPTTALYQPDTEANAIALVLRFKSEVWADFHLTTRADFSEPNRPIWEHVALQLGQMPQGSLDPLLLSEKIRAAGVSQLQGGFEVYPYLEGLLNRDVAKTEAINYARELTRLRVRRELLTKMNAASKELVDKPSATFEEMTGLVEKTLTSVATDYYKGDEFENVFETIEEVTEARAANPVNAMEMGWMGPFPSINRTLGALTFPGSFTTIAARTGDQKSSLGFHYHVHLAERYNLPVLLLDVGEMTLERIQRRAVACLSKGRVPLWAIASGEWEANKEWKHIIRDEVWPRVKKLRIDYINIGHLSPREKLSLIRRYYYNRVGRGNEMCILDDYLKGIEALGKNNAEHQAIGYYVNDVKNLITQEIPASFWTSVQKNRSGSYQGKRASEIVESEDQIGLSDRIIQQSDWGFLLRFKIPEEMGMEKQLFGNMKMSLAKKREIMGKEFEKALKPIKLPDGKFAHNYYNLDSKGFYFTDKGDLNAALEVLGQAVVDVATDKTAHAAARPL